MEEFLKIGHIVKPQGIKGQVKVAPLTDDINRFKKLNEAYIDGVMHKVAGVIISGNFCFVAFSDITDRNSAETLRNKYISVRRENAVLLKENEFFICDIENSTVKDEEGNVLGVVTEVTSAKTDFFTVRTPKNRIFRFPFLKKVLISVDTADKTVIVNKKVLEEISVYED